MVTVQVGAGAQPWLGAVYGCAGQQAVTVRLVDLPSEADLQLRLGEPPYLGTPAYRVGSDDLVVLVNRDSALSSLSETQVRDLFSRGGDGFQVWVYASGEDIQQVFEGLVLRGRQVTSHARLAGSTEQMLAALAADKNAVGLAPGLLVGEDVRAVYVWPQIPVLAISPAEPEGAARLLLSCLQE